MSPMQRCFSDLVCQPSVTSYVIDAYLCLAMLHAWTLDYQHIMDALCLRRDKANGQLEKSSGSPRNVWLNKVQEDANVLLLSMQWRPDIARGHGGAQRFTWTMR